MQTYVKLRKIGGLKEKISSTHLAQNTGVTIWVQKQSSNAFPSHEDKCPKSIARETDYQGDCYRVQELC